VKKGLLDELQNYLLVELQVLNKPCNNVSAVRGTLLIFCNAIPGAKQGQNTLRAAIFGLLE
jgi:hypothetical protein